MVAKGKRLLGSPPEHLQLLLTNISSLQSSDKFTDVIFQCSGGQVPAHKAMLTPLSPLLRKMFELSFSMQSADVTVITLAGVDVGPVMRMMAYIYTGQLTQSSKHESSEIQEIANILQIKIDLSVEKAESTPKSSKGSGKQRKTSIRTPPNTEDDPLTEDEEIPTPTIIKSRGRSKKSNEEDAIVMDVDLMTPEVSPKSPPRRLGGFRSFDNGQIQEAIMENAKTRAESDKMQVGLTNVSKDKNKSVAKMYKSATVDLAEQNFHENIVENPVFTEDEDLFNTSGGRSSRQSKAEVKKKDNRIEKEKQVTEIVENVDFEEEYEVEEILDKRDLLGKTEYLVKWRGWEDIADRTWEPVDNLEGAEKLIVSFEKMQKENEKVESSKKRTSKEVTIVDDLLDDDYEVENILDKRGKGKKVEYLVKWKNFDKVEDQTWEPLENLTESSNIVEAFEKEFEEKDSGSKSVNKELETPTSRKRRPDSVTPDHGSLSVSKRGRPKQSITSPVDIDKTNKKSLNNDDMVEDLLDDDYEAEKILDKRGKGKKLEYLVKWKNFEKEEDQTWEPMDNLTESREIVELFEKELQEKDKQVMETETPTKSKKTSKRGRSKSVTPSKHENEVEEEEEYEVEKILDVRKGGMGKEFLVKWKGWEKKEDQTWEPEDSLEASKQLVKDFEKSSNQNTSNSTGSKGKKKKKESIDPSEVIVLDDSKDDDDLTANDSKNTSVDSEDLPLSSFQKPNKRGKKSKSTVGKDKLESKPDDVDDSKDEDVAASDLQNISGDSEDLPLSTFQKQNKRGRKSNQTPEKPVRTEKPVCTEIPADLDEEEEEAEYEVEKILDRQEVNGVAEYLVKWKNWDREEDNTWEPSTNLVGSEDLIEKYEKKLKLKTGKEEKRSSEPAPESSKKKKQDKPLVAEESDNDVDEYEVELIVDKRDAGGVTEYLVKWKGWEKEEDRTWEPVENLEGSEKLIKKFEAAENKSKTKQKKEATPKKQTAAEDGVVLCVTCNRIFLSCEALRSHDINEHNKSPVTPKIKKVANEVRDEIEKDTDEKVVKRKRSMSGEIANLACFNCGLDSKSKSDLKNHVLSHYYGDFYAILPASKPFTCPTCSLESRDRISLVRHFAFTHKEIYKFCTHEQLTNSSTDASLDNEVEDDGGASSHAHKPGPRSKKFKAAPFSDETLHSDESKSPPRSAVSPRRRTSDKVGEIIRASDKRVDLSDSSDDEENRSAKPKKDEVKSFDELFSESSVTNKKVAETKVVFNKDSDDESDHEKGHADVDDLMGGSDDDKSKNGDDNNWDLENI